MNTQDLVIADLVAQRDKFALEVSDLTRQRDALRKALKRTWVCKVRHGANCGCTTQDIKAALALCPKEQT